MRIAIVGVDRLGTALALAWSNTGHQVSLADAADPRRAEGLADQIGPSARASGVDEAARDAEVIVLTVGVEARELLPRAPTTAGKIVIDAVNPASEGDASIDHGRRFSSAIVAEWFPDAAVVKAFNTIDAEVLRDEARPHTPRDRRFAIFLAGDNSRANARVSTLIEEIGFTPIETGSLQHGGALQRLGSPIFGRLLLPAEARRLLELAR
jgi:predicted dinucleotide-binding enzyme